MNPPPLVSRYPPGQASFQRGQLDTPLVKSHPASLAEHPPAQISARPDVRSPPSLSSSRRLFVIYTKRSVKSRALRAARGCFFALRAAASSRCARLLLRAARGCLYVWLRRVRSTTRPRDARSRCARMCDATAPATEDSSTTLQAARGERRIEARLGTLFSAGAGLVGRDDKVCLDPCLLCIVLAC